MRSIHILALASLPLSVAACGGDDSADGTIVSTVYGEEFIEEGIPANVFADGWAMSFDSFLVSIGNGKAQAGHDNPEVGFNEFFIVDLAQGTAGAGTELATYDAPGGVYDHYGYQIKHDAGSTGLNATPADVTAMKSAGASIWVRGRATKGDVEKTFDWKFTPKLTYLHCAGEEESKVDGDEITMESTVHADHLFYDDAVSDEPDVSFDVVAAADGNSDNVITEAELLAKDIRGETRYQVGSARDPNGAEIENLFQYIAHQASTVGHMNGEGHCEDTIVEP